MPSNSSSLDLAADFSGKADCCPAGPEFREIIKATPLVSVDLLVCNENDEILLGKRVNRPAQGFWFVPGGRIRKNETIAEAVSRVAVTELGVELSLEKGRLLGAYDHIYSDNYWGDSEVNTHYVALAYSFNISKTVTLSGDDQHMALQWWSISDMLQSSDVHENTKAYYWHHQKK